MANVNYMQRVGKSSCIRCDFETDETQSFAAQDLAMSLHLNEAHPNWQIEALTPEQEVALAERCRNHKDKRIAELEAKMAALDWTPITESNLPNRGDEAFMLPTETHGARVIPVGFDAREGDAPRYIDAGYTHFRPINPPVQP